VKHKTNITRFTSAVADADGNTDKMRVETTGKVLIYPRKHKAAARQIGRLQTELIEEVKEHNRTRNRAKHCTNCAAWKDGVCGMLSGKQDRHVTSG